MRVTVLTASLPERGWMLTEAMGSVRDQTWEDVQHLYAIDENREGAGAILNRLLEEVSTDWVAVLDDDDLLDLNHFAVLSEHIHGADVVYSLPRVEGGSFVLYHHDFDPAVLARMNIVSHTALMRTEQVRRVGGWNNVRTFDWDLFKRLHGAGAVFRQVLEETWTYRLHGSNWSQGTLR